MIWWEKTSASNSQPLVVRSILDHLEDEAGPSRRRWAMEGPAILARSLQEVQRGAAVLLPDTPAPFHLLAERHDEALRLAFSAAVLVGDAYQVLGALRRTAVLVDARRNELARERSGLAPWRRGAIAGDMRELEQLQDQTIQDEIAQVTRERDRLVATVIQLLDQGERLRQRLDAGYGGAGRKWLLARGEWLQVGLENWERAQKGLRLRPLPHFGETQINVRAEGVVKWYNAAHGRGMIAPVNGGPDVHLPRSSLQGTSRLLPGQRVGYTVRESSIGPWAADVILIR